MKETWQFPYTADVLTDAAFKKMSHHDDRMKWWLEKQAEKFAEIKEKGLTIHESVAANSSFGLISNSYQQPTITLDHNLTSDLTECQNKVAWHKAKVAEYEAWVEVLSSQGKSTFNLNHSDWLFFFGTR